MLFYVILYVYIYNPAVRVLSLASIRLLYPFMILWIIKYPKYFFSVLKWYNKDLMAFGLLLLFTFFYTIVGGDFLFFKNILLLFLDGYVLSLFVLNIYYKYIRNTTLSDSLYIIAVIAAISSLVLFLNPGLNEFVRSNFSLEDTDRKHFLYRCFGFSSGLTFEYGIIQGLALVYCIHYRKSFFSIILIPLFLLSVLLNARTGIIMPLLYILYNSFFRFKVRYWIFILIVICCILMLLNSDYYYEYEYTITWALEGFYEISDSIFGTELASFNTFETLSENQTVYPNTVIEWLFGTGIDLYTASGVRSDSGYIIQLNYGGICFMSLIFFLLTIVFNRVKKMDNKNAFRMFAFILLTMMICNYKGNLLNSNIITRLFFLLYIYMTFYKMSEPTLDMNEKCNI